MEYDKLVIEMKEMSKKFVDEHVNNPTKEDYIAFENAMFQAATYVVLQILAEEKFK